MAWCRTCPEREHGRKRSGFFEIKWVGGPCFFSIMVPGFALRASARIDGGETTAKQPPTHLLIIKVQIPKCKMTKAAKIGGGVASTK